MNLVYIENKELLTKIVTYLDYGKIEYTTNINSDFQTLIIAQNNKKTNVLMKKAKKIVYISYLDEFKISNSYNKKSKKYINYKQKMNNFFNSCTFIIVSIPFFEKIINSNKTVVIPKENLCIGLCRNKIFNMKRKTITIIDSNYKYLDKCIGIVNTYSNYQYELIGYNCNISKKQNLLLNNIPKNLKLIKYCNERLLQNYINNSFLVIFFDNILKSSDYLNICFNLKKNMLVLNSELCDDYLIDNKNIYLFNLDDILKKINKIINNRVCNLGLEEYNLVKNNDFKNTATRLTELLKN